MAGPTTVNYTYDPTGERLSYTTGSNTTYYPSQFYNIDSEGKTTKHIFAGSLMLATIQTGDTVSSETTSSCIPPASGDWIVTTSCTFEGTATVPASVIVNANKTLTLAAGSKLLIDLKHYKLLVKHTGGLLIKKTATLRQIKPEDITSSLSTEGTTISYHLTDHLGSTQISTDATGAVTELSDYYPYGSIRIDEGSSKEQRKYIGEEYDPNTGLNYLNARYYNSKVGQFISQDPVFIEMNDFDLLQDPQQMNAYSYGRNNPLKYIDPDGEKVELVVRPVFTKYDGHLFYHITPDNPDQINVNGLPAGTKEFSIAGYNRGGFLGVGNKLTPEIGYEGMKSPNTDSQYLLGQKDATARMTITPPNGQSDTDFINALGQAANGIDKESYFTLGQRFKFGNANSNNFAHEIGSRVGVGDQVTEFSNFKTNKVYVPGGDKGLPKNSLRQIIRQGVSEAGKQINRLTKKTRGN